MKNKKAMTLVEIVVVVMVISILAAISFPKYQRTVERSKLAEAVSMLGSIRGAALRYYDDKGVFLAGAFNNWNFLDVEVPDYHNTSPPPNTRFWDYALIDDQNAWGDGNVIAYARRRNPSDYGRYYVGIEADGDILHDTISAGAPFAGE